MGSARIRCHEPQNNTTLLSTLLTSLTFDRQTRTCTGTRLTNHEIIVRVAHKNKIGNIREGARARAGVRRTVMKERFKAPDACLRSTHGTRHVTARVTCPQCTKRVRTSRHRHTLSRVRGKRRAPGIQLVSPHRVAKGLERLGRVPLEWRLHEAHDDHSAHP